MWATQKKKKKKKTLIHLCLIHFSLEQGLFSPLMHRPKGRINTMGNKPYNPCGVPAVSNPPTNPPTYSVRKISPTTPMQDEESRRRDDSLISSGSGCGWLYFPRLYVGNPKKKKKKKHLFICVWFVSVWSKVCSVLLCTDLKEESIPWGTNPTTPVGCLL